jgi:hypothetical protein
LELASSIGTNRGNWAASTAYNARDIAKDTGNGNIYWCNTDHTSSGSLPISSNADVAKWNLLVDAASATASAGAVAYKYTFSDSTSMADPGAGIFRFNHATVSSATAIAIDDTTAASGNPDVSAFLVSLDDGTNTTHYGYVTIRKDDTPATFALFSITALTDNSGWVQFTLTHVASNGSWTDADAAHISFTRSGNRGNDAGLDMTFESTTTDTDQGVGKTWLNNATPASATVFYMDDVDINSASINSFVDSWDDANSTIKGYIELSKQSDPAVFALYSITGAVTSASTYSKVAVTYITGAGSFTDADPVNVAFIRAGTKGDPAGLDMLFEDTTTDTDQGASKTWLNHATVASATVLYMDDVDVNSASINSFVDSWDDSTNSALRGTITMKKKGDNAVFAIFNVTGAVTSASTYSKVAVTYVTGAGSFTDADPISVQFVRTGNQGGGLAGIVDDTTPQLGAALDTNSFALNESEGAAVASATTTDIFGGDDGNTLHITGTTQIDDFTDASSVGQWRKIIFDGILTLTHGSGITLPANEDITTAVGDYAYVYADTVSAFTVLYFRADGSQLSERLGTAIASATTTDIFGNADGETVHITGTTTISDFTDAPRAGMYRKIIFDGALTFTHGSGITIPGSASITTAANDWALIHADTVSAFSVVAYTKADGTGIVSAGGGWVELQSVAASGSSVDLETDIGSTYTEYMVKWSNVYPSTDDGTMNATLKVGGSYVTDAAYRRHAMIPNSSIGTYAGNNSAADTKIQVAFTFGNASGEGSDGTLYFGSPTGTDNFKRIYFTAMIENSAGTSRILYGIGSYTGAVTAMTGIRLAMSTGNFSSGQFTLYGLTKA